MSVTVNNSPIQDKSFTLMITYAQPTAVVTPGFKPFAVPYYFDEIIPSNIVKLSGLSLVLFPSIFSPL